MIGAGSTTAPFAIKGVAALHGFRDATGRAPRQAALVAGERTGIFIVAGQSMAANHVNAAYVPISSKIEHLSIFDGGLYAAAEPKLGCSGTGGSWLDRFADKMIADGTFDRVILVPIAIGGSIIAAWAPGGDFNQLLRLAANRLAARGLAPTAYIWVQGESDGQIGTTSAAWQASFNAMVAAERAAGLTAPWFVGKSTYIGSASNATIRAAQAAVVTGTIYAGADTDDLGNAYRYDTTHWNASGADLSATRWQTAVGLVF